ncbi:MAG: hypothetical protein NTW19_24645 [Planctomycetota bacterium]|nr:hypothetical protein [Planctomycetota bacterium]
MIKHMRWLVGGMVVMALSGMAMTAEAAGSHHSLFGTSTKQASAKHAGSAHVASASAKQHKHHTTGSAHKHLKKSAHHKSSKKLHTGGKKGHKSHHTAGVKSHKTSLNTSSGRLHAKASAPVTSGASVAAPSSDFANAPASSY